MSIRAKITILYFLLMFLLLAALIINLKGTLGI